MKKACRQCQTEVRLADFYRMQRTPDGLMYICKSCHKANVRENYVRNIEHYKEYDRGRAMAPHRVAARNEYQSTPEGRAAVRRAHDRFKERNPTKRAAHVLVGNAIRAGRLARKPCEVCGAVVAHAHHDDYSKPLDVRWLCTAHHAEWHKHNTPLCPDQEQAA